MLIHVNGAPGMGKSSLARRWVADNPLTLLLEIDEIRAALGGWEDVPESRLIARDLAVALAEAHLGAGRDVVVPQYVGRNEFIATLEGSARGVGAVFVEVLMDAPVVVAVNRFNTRRGHLRARGQRHTEGEVPDELVEAAVEDARERLAQVAVARGGVIQIRADRSLEDTYAELLAAFRDHSG
jgi:predicted kinase